MCFHFLSDVFHMVDNHMHLYFPGIYLIFLNFSRAVYHLYCGCGCLARVHFVQSRLFTFGPCLSSTFVFYFCIHFTIMGQDVFMGNLNYIYFSIIYHIE